MKIRKAAIPNRMPKTNGVNLTPIGVEGPPEKVATSDVPSVEMLALIAAQSRFQNLSPQAATQHALDVFEAAKNTLYELNNRNETLWQGIPRPTSFPASITDFFRVIVKGKSKSESESRYRKFVRSLLQSDRKFSNQTDETISDEEIETVIQSHKDLVQQPHNWRTLAKQYSTWWECQVTGSRRAGFEAQESKGNSPIKKKS